MPLNLAIFLVGLSGIVAQVLLLRELLVGFCGSELVIGLILGNWIILESAGAFIGAKITRRIKEKIDPVIILQVIFSLSLPVCLYLARVFKRMVGFSFAEAVGLPLTFFGSLFVLLPLAVLHGALFTLLCYIYPVYIRKSGVSFGRIYGWEAFATLVGGALFTYLLLPTKNCQIEYPKLIDINGNLIYINKS